MDELFRMMAMRAPDTTAGSGSLSVASGSAWQATLPAQGTLAAKRRGMKDAADALMQSPAFVADVGKLAYGAQIAQFYAAIDSAQGAPQNFAALDALITQCFGKTAAALMQDAELQSEQTRLADTLVAVFISPATTGDLLAAVARALELFDVIRRVAANDQTL